MAAQEDAEFVPAIEPGLHCFGCAFNASETLEEGYLSHGYPEEELTTLVRDLNGLLLSQPERPALLTLTRDGALALKEIMEQEGKLEEALQVGVDEKGGFCLEFHKEPEEGSYIFFHREVPEVRMFATSLTLSRIGGSTIDFREGRFKLDLSDAQKNHSCGCGKGECGC